MQGLKRILVDLDPMHEEQPALQKALYLAKQCDAELCLFLVAYNRGLVSSLFFGDAELEAAKQGYLNSQKRWLDTYVNEAKAFWPKVSSKVVWHKPVYEAIINEAEQGGFDLILKSTRHHPTINKILFSPNDWQLLKSTSKPVILCKEQTRAAYGKIMAAIDPSHRHDHARTLDPLILKASQFFADTCKAELHCMHCFDPIGYQLWNDIGLGMGVGMGPADFTMGEDNYQAYVEQLKRDNQALFEKALMGVNCDPDKCHLVEGYPEQEIPALAREQAIDLVVMGTSYHSGLVGSTTEKVLDELPCDLLAVPLPKAG